MSKKSKKIPDVKHAMEVLGDTDDLSYDEMSTAQKEATDIYISFWMQDNEQAMDTRTDGGERDDLDEQLIVK